MNGKKADGGIQRYVYRLFDTRVGLSGSVCIQRYAVASETAKSYVGLDHGKRVTLPKGDCYATAEEANAVGLERIKQHVHQLRDQVGMLKGILSRGELRCAIIDHKPYEAIGEIEF